MARQRKGSLGGPIQTILCKGCLGKSGEVLDKVQQKLHKASSTIDKVAARRRVIDRKLRGVEVS
jgi:hypothetical protein